MSKLCTISVVGLHLLFLTHIAHSFVLLTANVDDVKKIARKFVSDSLAEKITDFIAKATATLAEEKKTEYKKNFKENKAQDSVQVSAENRMYNVEKTVNDRLDDSIKTEEEATVTPRSFNTEKERHQKVEFTTSKPKKAQPKPLHGRSRYIEPEKITETTEKSTTQIILKETKKILEEKHITSPSVTKAKQQFNKTKSRYKLLSGFDDVNKTAVTAGKPVDKSKIDGKPLVNPKRAMGEEEAARTEIELYDSDNKYLSEKAENEFDEYANGENKHSEKNVNEFDHDNVKNQNTEKAVNKYDQYDIDRNKNTDTDTVSSSMSEKDEYDTDVNNIIPIDDKEVTRGSLVKEKDYNDEKWWEKDLPTHIQHDADVQTKGKSWF